MKEREISLCDLFFELLLRWRQIILVILGGMILLGSYSYITSYRTSKLQLEQGSKVNADSEHVEFSNQETTKQLGDSAVSLEQLEAEITEVQQHNVEYMMMYEKIYLDKMAYAQESVFMQMDPNDVKWAEISFLVTSDDFETTYNLVRIYEDFICSGEMFEDIAKQLNLSTSVIGEVITLERESYSLADGTNTIRVKVIHYDEVVCQEIAQCIIAYLEEKCNELNESLGNHNIAVLSKSCITVSDEYIRSEQRTFWSDLATLENVVINCKAKFTEIEWQYYDILLNGEITELSISKMTDSVSGLSNTIQNPTGLGTKIDNNRITTYASINLLHVVLGGVLALFIYVFIFFVCFILNGKIRVTDNLQNIYMIPQLGVITKSEKSTRFLGFVDDWIISLRDWNKRKFTREEAINLAAVAVKMAAGKDDLISICLIGCDLKEQTLAVCDQMKAVLDNDNITVEILNNILYDAQAMSKLQFAQGAVLVETAGSTLYTEIAQEMELLKRQDIKVLGGIMVE